MKNSLFLISDLISRVLIIKNTKNYTIRELFYVRISRFNENDSA